MKRRAEELNAATENNDTVHPARKRRLEYTEADAQLAKLYNDLSDEVKATRIKAAAGLVRALKDAEPARLDQSLTRLIRGLCSSRKASRSGFFVALVEVLQLTKPTDSHDNAQFTPLSLIAKVESLTEPEGSANNQVSLTIITSPFFQSVFLMRLQEKRDYLLGRCIAFKALIQSRVLFQDAPDQTAWQTLLDHVFALIVEYPSVRKDYGAILYESLPSLALLKQDETAYAQTLLQKLQSLSLAKSAEGLAIWLSAVHLFPGLSLSKNVWHYNDPLNSKERAVVAKILRDGSNTETADAASTGKSGNGTPQSMPSFAWTPVLQELYRRYTATSKTSDFEKFWTEAVDGEYLVIHVCLSSANM